MTVQILSTLAGLLGATAFGSMVFFAAVVAPLVFTRLPEEVAGRFIREVFPWYYLALGLVTAAAALAAGFAAQPGLAVPFAAVAAGFVYARQILMPRINGLRDRELAGEAAAGPLFQRAHRQSVVLNLAQLLILLGILVRIMYR